MNCKQAHHLIHDYFDENILPQDGQLLTEHLNQCLDCKDEFQTLKQTIIIMKSSSHLCAPHGFTDRVMERLPRETFIIYWKKKFQHHPFLVAASLFLLLMTGSTFSLWNGDKQFQLSANQPQNIEIDKQHGKVIVPVDRVVQGDIVVRNADLTVLGKVQGNVTAIDGHIFLASTGSVTGEKQEINETVEWVWYNIKKMAEQLIP